MGNFIITKNLPKEGLKVANEAVYISLAGCLVDDILVVIVAEAPRELLIVHFGLVLSKTPEPRHLIGICQLEFPSVTRP